MFINGMTVPQESWTRQGKESGGPTGLPSGNIPPIILSRMLKKSSRSVLASFRPSTYPKGTPSDPHSLRPCWRSFLNILQDGVLFVRGVLFCDTSSIKMGFTFAF